MNLEPDKELGPSDLLDELVRFNEISGAKILAINEQYDESKGSAVFTVEGKYATRGWTEWTQGFVCGSAILQYDVTNDGRFLEIGRGKTMESMAQQVTHFGVHDHGFNNISTYANLLRLQREGRIPANEWETRFYELALKCSGAVQAKRWTKHKLGGFIHSFNGPHSLFVDTIRSCRSLCVAHSLGHCLMDENDEPVNLLKRSINHARSTAAFNVFYGEGRDSFDLWGRVAHEAIFNVLDGAFRCTNSQQGFSGFTTWTRGLAWAMVGFAEQLEYLDVLDDEELADFGGRRELDGFMEKAARATCDFYLENSASDGIPYWDTGAPNLSKLGDDYLSRPADPFNAHEPVDSSAAAIACQGLIRLGRYIDGKAGKRYFQAGLNVLRTLLNEPYLSTAPSHQGLLLHSVYHRPNGWDHLPSGQ
ncbi:MAG: glycosyl hydrolase, partial [Opitutales bacterium]